MYAVDFIWCRLCLYIETGLSAVSASVEELFFCMSHLSSSRLATMFAEMPRRGKFAACCVFACVLISGCRLSNLREGPEQERKAKVQSLLQSVKSVYVQSFTGINVVPVRDALFATLAESGAFKVTELLPDSLENLAVLRVAVKDHTLWENEEVPTDGETLIRRNALIGVRISLFDAKTGYPLVRENISQAFQQIYAGEKEAKKRIPEKREMSRLRELLAQKILARLKHRKERERKLDLKAGRGDSWLFNSGLEFGSRRIIKGNRMARAGNLEQAKRIWKLVLFAPPPAESSDIRRLNMACVYHNLGQVYRQQGHHLLAAEMFSRANGIERRAEYAQAWGDSMLAYIEKEKKRRGASKGAESGREVEMSAVRPASATMGRDLPFDGKMLLNPKVLWPLEPIVKELHI